MKIVKYLGSRDHTVLSFLNRSNSRSLFNSRSGYYKFLHISNPPIISLDRSRCHSIIHNMPSGAVPMEIEPKKRSFGSAEKNDPVKRAKVDGGGAADMEVDLLPDHPDAV